MWSQLNKTDRRILSTAILLMLLMLYFLYDDSLILPSDNSKNLQAIGHLSQADRDVRRKISKQFMWRSARPKDRLHIGDSVFTGQNSKVTIDLKDGRTLTLQENSLVVFNTTGDQLSLDLRFGQVSGQISGCLKMTLKGEEREVCGDGSELKLDSDGVVQKKIEPQLKDGISWIASPPAEFFHYKNNMPMRLSWKSELKFGRFKVQFSRQPDFRETAYEVRTRTREVITRGYPVTGDYFIRIQGEDIKGRAIAFSKPQKISIRELQPPVITTPLAQAKTRIPKNVDGELLQSNQIAVEWTYPLKNTRFDFQISQKKDFSELLLETQVISGFQSLTPPLESGQYYVRVRQNISTGEAERPWSAIVPFTVQIEPTPELPAPKLLTSRFDYLAPQDEPLKVQWEPVTGAHQYQLEVAKSPDFIESKVYTSGEGEVTVPDLEPGRFFFRIRAETAKGTTSKPSAIGQWEVKLKKPILNPVEPITVMGKTPEDPGDPQKIPVSWMDLKYAESYQIQVSKHPDFKVAQEFQSQTPTAEVIMPAPGDYYWRVRATTAKGRPTSRFSVPGQLKYNLKVPLATPEMIEPFDEMTLFFQKKMSPYIWFEWKTVRQATRYNLEIALDPQFNQKVVSVTSKSRRYLLKEPLPQATLYWRIQAQGDDDRISHWSAPRKMTVFSGRAPANLRRPASPKRN
jgi:hypothetical protein